MMEPKKQTRLESAGWQIGGISDFLDLTPEEVAFVEMKVSLARYARRLRTESRMTQTETALLLGSSQSRIAKMEAADATVSLDLLVKALLSLGATPADVGRVIASPGPTPRASTPGRGGAPRTARGGTRCGPP